MATYPKPEEYIGFPEKPILFRRPPPSRAEIFKAWRRFGKGVPKEPRRPPRLKGFLKKLGIAFLTFLLAFFFLVFILYLWFGRGGEAQDLKWGASFDPYYAQYLGLDWKKTYLSILEELGVDHLRLVAFWDQIEPEKDVLRFEDLDFQMQEAEKRGVKVILAIGRRLPRWPECHTPNWAKDLPERQQQFAVLELLPKIVNRYKESPALEFWQVENESWVWFFGECPPADEIFLRAEIDLVQKLDPSHPVIATESGELSSWYLASRLPTDYVGISLYRMIYDSIFFHRYNPYPIPQEYYRIKANFFKRLGWIKEVFVAELQAEPWSNKPLPQTPLSEQYITLSPAQLAKNLAFAKSTGLSRFYLWGAEYWYYAREKLGVSEFWEEAKNLWK